MADQEVIKHTKKVISVVKHAEHSVGQKVREIALEVLIIVFAVSASIWLHGISEHRHEQQKVKTFLLGLKNDLQTNSASLKKESEVVRERTQVFTYLAGLDAGSQPDKAEFAMALDKVMFPRFGVFLQAGRYESFKSSGRLMNIENEQLLQSIVYEFETGMRAVHGGEAFTKERYAQFRNFMDDGIDAGIDPLKLITSPKGRRLCHAMTATALDDYRVMDERLGEIVKKINAMYPEEAASPALSRPS